MHDVNLTADSGHLLALLGPSGCGKTTLLRVLAGLLEPVRGQVLFDDAIVTRVVPEQRGTAMVFQKPLLFPHLSVEGNVAFGLRMRGVPREAAGRRVREALSLVRLQGFNERRSNELSGGQEQRVALARALVTEPRVLLLDEPFASLDEELRAEMRDLVRELQQRSGITTVFVTHDQAEAARIADRVALMLEGCLEQAGTAGELVRNPATAAAARFFGWRLWRTQGARQFYTGPRMLESNHTLTGQMRGSCQQLSIPAPSMPSQ